MTLTLGSRSHKLLTMKLLCPTVQEKMHLQENTLFDLDPKVKVT